MFFIINMLSSNNRYIRRYKISLTSLPMKKAHLLAYVVLLIVVLQSCKSELDITNSPDAKLEFSTDTILFDTVFTTVGSVTKRIKIYNRNKSAINISKVDLIDSTSFAKYRLNIDGFAGNHLRNIEIPAEDSIFGFIEMTVKAGASSSSNPFFVGEQLSFETNTNVQKIEVLAFGQNAHFFVDSILTGNLTWNDDLPYVIYGGVLVDTLSSLTINPGVKIYMHNNAIILSKGTIQMNGTIQDSITIQGDRRELQFYNEPGQWNGIQFLPGSTNNIINHTTIKSSVFGVIVGTFPIYGIQPELKITNSIIKYSTVTGMYLIDGNVKAYNNLVFACGQYTLLTQLGGKYDIIHNTFAQTNSFSTRQTPAVAITDYLLVNNVPVTDGLDVVFKNNIVTGTLKDEYFIETKSSSTAEVITTFNMLKSSKTWPSSNLLNKDPLFKDPSITLSNNYTENYRLKPNSTLRGKAEYQNSPAELLIDADGITRINPSTIGCYE